MDGLDLGETSEGRAPADQFFLPPPAGMGSGAVRTWLAVAFLEAVLQAVRCCLHLLPFPPAQPPFPVPSLPRDYTSQQA